MIKNLVPKPGSVDPTKCSHAFVYWSVFPPTHCYLCGTRLIPEDQDPQDYYPRPIWKVDFTPHHQWRPDLAPTY